MDRADVVAGDSRRLGLTGQRYGVEGDVQGFGSSKRNIEANPKFVEWAHAEEMTVVPYTFWSSGTGKFPNVKAEMEHFLYAYGVDGVFTDHPDQFPRHESFGPETGTSHM